MAKKILGCGKENKRDIQEIRISLNENCDIKFPYKNVNNNEVVPIKLIEDEINAEFIGFFIAKGLISKRHAIYFSFNLDDHEAYVSYIKNLIIAVFGRSPSLQGSKGNRRRFYIGGKEIVQYLESQHLLNKSVPLWIKKSRSWIHDNQQQWKEDISPLVISCLRGMINGGGSIFVSHNRIEIVFSKSNKLIVEDFMYLCNILNIHTGKIQESVSKYKNWNTNYGIQISAINSVKRFLIDLVKPLKWELMRDDIQLKLAENNLSIEDVLEINSELKNIRRKVYKHQKLKFTFQYNIYKIKRIDNPILRDYYYNYIENISFKLFPENEFEIETNVRPSRLKFIGEHEKTENGSTAYREVIKTDFIKEHLINNNSHIKKYYYDDLPKGFFKDILDIVRTVYKEFQDKNLGHPWHEPILKEIMIKLPNALASEIPIWKKLEDDYCVGHIDLNLINNNTFFIADLKDNEVDIIKSLPQLMVYAINQRQLIFKNIAEEINFYGIAFTKDELWIFDPIPLKNDILEFIKYTNDIRTRNLKSLPYPSDAERTDLLKDIEKSVAFLQVFIDQLSEPDNKD